MSKYFAPKQDCEVVAAARFGFQRLDDAALLDDHQYRLINIYKPELNGQTATVEVRFWTVLAKDKDPLQQDHGGAVVSLKKEEGHWKIANLESVDLLGAEGFRPLIESYPTAVNPQWQDMDYKKSLSQPKPF